jgi:hypothetical protein
MNHSTMLSATEELFALQVAQLRHDEKYHREIARMPTQARITHMALHFCKYVGQLATGLHSDDKSLIKKTMTDTFVIGLSSANTLNLHLATVLPEAESSDSLSALCRRLLEKNEISGKLGNGWLLYTYAIAAGRMARSCEKLDHLEAFPFREEIAAAVGTICAVSLSASQQYGFDIRQSVVARFNEIEEKHLFHSIP